jgi:photosystem II stability/assembly factor-like uncharacterized protein
MIRQSLLAASHRHIRSARLWASVSLVAIAALLFLLACSKDSTTVKASGARLDAWRVIGPGGGGAQFLPTISPHNTNTMLVRCDMTGTYMSSDAGENWRMINLRGTADFYVFDPVDPQTIYTHTIGLFRSRDGGKTWHLIHPDPESVKEVVMPSDHADERIVLKDGPTPQMTALAVDPSNSKILYASVSEGQNFTVRRSVDDGKTWTTEATLPARGLQIAIDPKSSPSDRDVYVVTPDGVFSRRDGTWALRGKSPENLRFSMTSIGFAPEGGPPRVYAVVEGQPMNEQAPSRFFISRDGGASWNSVEKAIGEVLGGWTPRLRFPAVAAASHKGDSVYLSFDGVTIGEPKGQQVPGQRWRNNALGVVRSDDGGRTFRVVWKEPSRGPKSPHVDDGWISTWFGPGWGSSPFGLGVAPHNPEIAYATDFGRTLRTTDGGKTWKAMYTRKVTENSYTSNGMDVTTAYGVHFDPFDPKRILISYTDIGAFLSEDGGRSWMSATWRTVPRAWSNTAYWMEFDPKVKGRVWSVFSGSHDLPRPKMWRNRSPERYRGGIAVSDDGAKTWKVLNQGMPEMAATHFVIDPDSPADKRVIYVAGFGRGVYKTTDGGATWELKNNGITRKEPFAWWISRDPNNKLYLVIARRSEDGSIGDEGDGALYTSVDGAESWQSLPLPEGVNGPNGLTVDASNPNRLYLAAWGRRGPERALGGGIFVSKDAGKTWRNTLSKDQHIYDVTQDPRNPDILYACGFESSVWKSTDRGETWKRLRGYNFKWGHRVIPDPHDASKIYVTTFGGSVWHGPVDGDPNATEDIVTPVVAFGQ